MTDIKLYNEYKATYPDTILLFRRGSFYRAYNDDAIKLNNILETVLFNNPFEDVEFASGFTFFKLDTYLPKLVRAGHRVAICD